MQAHPDKPFSEKYFHSRIGKAEAWVVLETRQNAKIHFVFKEQMTKERFPEAIEKRETDISATENPMISAIDASKEYPIDRYVHLFEGDLDDTLRQAVGA